VAPGLGARIFVAPFVGVDPVAATAIGVGNHAAAGLQVRRVSESSARRYSAVRASACQAFEDCFARRE